MVYELWTRIDPKEAEIVRRFLKSPPVRVGEIAVALGLKVVRAPLPPKISGLIKPSEESPSGFEIRVNKYEVPDRQRFTVAHEIAHFLLHRDSIGAGVVDSVLYRSTLTSRKEAEANKLAAEIIMPKTLVREELERFGDVTTPEIAEQMAKIFKVSPPAMKVRLGIV